MGSNPTVTANWCVGTCLTVSPFLGRGSLSSRWAVAAEVQVALAANRLDTGVPAVTGHVCRATSGGAILASDATLAAQSGQRVLTLPGTPSSREPMG